MTESDTRSYKQSAVQYLQMVTTGKIKEAYAKYVDMTGKHHNLFFPAGFPALQQAMIENDFKFPHKKFTIKNVIAEGNMVAVHSHVVLIEGEKGMAVVHMFRFKGDKIVEMWDCGQAIPEDCPNVDGAF